MDNEQHRAREIAGKWLALLWVRQPAWLAKMPEIDDVSGLIDDIAEELRKRPAANGPIALTNGDHYI